MSSVDIQHSVQEQSLDVLDAKISWQIRCVEKMLSIDSDIDMTDASQMAIAMWSLDRFRAMPPEAVAALLMDNGAIRPSRR